MTNARSGVAVVAAGVGLGGRRHLAFHGAGGDEPGRARQARQGLSEIVRRIGSCAAFFRQFYSDGCGVFSKHPDVPTFVSGFDKCERSGVCANVRDLLLLFPSVCSRSNQERGGASKAKQAEQDAAGRYTPMRVLYLNSRWPGYIQSIVLTQAVGARLTAT